MGGRGRINGSTTRTTEHARRRPVHDALEEARMDHATRVLYQATRSLVSYRSLADFLKGMYEGFPSLVSTSVYMSRTGERLDHYLTVERIKKGFSTRSFDESLNAISDIATPEMIAYQTFQALILDFARKRTLTFNLRPNDFTFTAAQLAIPGEGMRCILPLYAEEAGKGIRFGVMSFNGKDTLLSAVNEPGRVSRVVLGTLASITSLVSHIINKGLDRTTFLPRKEEFMAAIGELESAWNSQKQNFSIVMIDFDGFKAVNDKHGHINGDIVLRALAETIVNSTRVKHGRYLDKVFRWGGEEFVIIVQDDVENVAILSERIRQNIENARVVLPDCSETVNVTCSIGIAEAKTVFTGDAKIMDLLKAMDHALYKAKGRGKNRTVIHGDSE